MSSKMTRSEEKILQFTAVITQHFDEMLNYEHAANPIDREDLNEFTTEFIHAMSNVVPWKLFCSITGDKIDMLGFNHIANRLVVQFSQPDSSASGESSVAKEGGES